MATKQCFKCGREKDLSGFYVHPKMRDGHLNKCKDCTRAEARKHREDNLEKVLAYDRERGYLPHRKAHVKAYAKTEAGKQAHYRSTKKYRKKFPEKYLARGRVNYALRTGKLQKKPCEVCGSLNTVAHHDDYSKALDVRWLCQKCHTEHHKRVDG